MNDDDDNDLRGRAYRWGQHGWLDQERSMTQQALQAAQGASQRFNGQASMRGLDAWTVNTSPNSFRGVNRSSLPLVIQLLGDLTPDEQVEAFERLVTLMASEGG